MKYYISVVEQVYKDESYAEYGTKTQYPDYNSAVAEYYRKLMNISLNLGKSHTYGNVKIENSTGTVIKNENVGTYVNQ